MIDIKHPKYVFAGDEVVCPAIEINSSDDALRITFHWGDDCIKVVGANMLEPNIFEFPPDQKHRRWYMKYAISQETKPSEKTPYITVDVIKTNWWQVVLFRTIAVILVLVPLVAYILKTIESSTIGNIFQVDISFGSLAISLPVGILLFVVLWSSKFTELIKRLSTIKETKKLDYGGKTFSLEPMFILPRRDKIAKNRDQIRSFENSTEFLNDGLNRYRNTLDDALRYNNSQNGNLASKSIHYAERHNDPPYGKLIKSWKKLFK